MANTIDFLFLFTANNNKSIFRIKKVYYLLYYLILLYFLGLFPMEPLANI